MKPSFRIREQRRGNLVRLITHFSAVIARKRVWPPGTLRGVKPYTAVMKASSPSYRTLQPVLVASLVTALLLPLIQHVCVGMGHSGVAQAQAYPAPDDACPSHADPTGGEQAPAPDDGSACCLFVADRATDRAALTTFDASSVEIALLAHVLAEWQVRAPVARSDGDCGDVGPLPVPVRPHLIHSVLLI